MEDILKKITWWDDFFYLDFFIPRPTKWGRGGIGVASDVRPSVTRPDVRISFPEQNSVTRAWISLIFDTHIP